MSIISKLLKKISFITLIVVAKLKIVWVKILVLCGMINITEFVTDYFRTRLPNMDFNILDSKRLFNEKAVGQMIIFQIPGAVFTVMIRIATGRDDQIEIWEKVIEDADDNDYMQFHGVFRTLSRDLQAKNTLIRLLEQPDLGNQDDENGMFPD